MKIHTLEQEQCLPVTIGEAWAFFSNPANLDRITPADLGFEITSPPSGEMFEGQIITYRVRIAPAVWVPWVTEIKCVDPGCSFIDEQRFGPYKFWHHRHHFESIDGGVRMRDLVHYVLPLGPLGSIAHAVFVRRKLEWIFNCRKRILKERFGELTRGPSPAPSSTSP
jgi:ligand-binding SRPBCC domain-containing protein